MAHEKASSMIADNAPEVAVPAPVSPILALRRRPFSTSRWTGCGGQFVPTAHALLFGQSSAAVDSQCTCI